MFRVSVFSEIMILKYERSEKIAKEQTCYKLQALLHPKKNSLDRTSSFSQMILYLKSSIQIDQTQDVILLDEVAILTPKNSSLLDSLVTDSEALRSFSKMILLSVLCNDIDECMVGNYGVSRDEFVRIDFEKAGENKSKLSLDAKIKQCIENALMFTCKDHLFDSVYQDVLSYLSEFCVLMKYALQDNSALLSELKIQTGFKLDVVFDTLLDMQRYSSDEPSIKRGKYEIICY